jgi:hypothetical protein
VGLRVVEQGGARRGRRVEVQERRAGSSNHGRFAGDEDLTGGMPSYSPPFPSCCGYWVYLHSDLITILLIPSFCSSYWVYMCTAMSYAGSAPGRSTEPQPPRTLIAVSNCPLVLIFHSLFWGMELYSRGSTLGIAGKT